MTDDCRLVTGTRVFAVLLFTLAGAACGSDSTSVPTVTSPTTTTTTVSETFTGTLAVSGVNPFMFTVSRAGAVSVTLASLLSSGSPVSTSVTVDLGVWSDPNCTPVTPTAVTPALTPQLTATLAAGAQCVRISDPGTLSGPLNFAIRVVHP